MKLAIIGAGRLGSALGARLRDTGHQVTFGTRGRSSREAATDADVVVLAVPFSSVEQALMDCGPLDGKLVWTCVNALKPDLSGLAVGFDTSAAEVVAAQARGARVVAALPPFADTIASGGTKIGGQTPTVWVCGDNEPDRDTVAGLVRDIGAEPSMAGPLAMSRLVEPAMMLMIAQAYSAEKPRTLGLKLLEA